ncbi:MAG: transcriptional repressor [Rhodospirillaceae bacterium]|jgi:Fur family transcriptional regulator, ferric uptake regulator|nr:transcriptional repressor [Rhodospirillaceae bacterium]MBT5047019.1 transcriptional repressor [Rhodospirillaceae bacterium]MBT5456343.1 transcriptional repressor [Rhodospirillaceae bacterium]
MAKAGQSKQAESAVSRIEKACLDKGMKMTEQRRVIARVLSAATDHPDVEEVYGRASAVDPRISIATVYRTLRLFDIANIIDRHDFGDGRSRYEVADEVGHHHHLIDMKNGHVLEFENEELENMKRRIARELGYDLVGDRLELYGVPIDTKNEGDD